jgi:hypothetical protein
VRGSKQGSKSVELRSKPSLPARLWVFTARLCQHPVPDFKSNLQLPCSSGRYPTAILGSTHGHMYHALIRTHHITSKKKIARLKAAAKTYQCFALLRTGGIPGVMYVSGGTKPDVQSWVDIVHDLRYKDYQLAAPVRSVAPAAQAGLHSKDESPWGVLEEVATVKEMAAYMESKGLINWWRVAMGFARE